MHMGRGRRRVTVVRSAVALGTAGLVIFGVTTPSATAQDNVLRANQSVARACYKSVLPRNAAGVDQREFTSTVDGLVQARLAAQGAADGDWDLAVFDKTTGGVVAEDALRVVYVAQQE